MDADATLPDILGVLASESMSVSVGRSINPLMDPSEDPREALDPPLELCRRWPLVPAPPPPPPCPPPRLLRRRLRPFFPSLLPMDDDSSSRRDLVDWMGDKNPGGGPGTMVALVVVAWLKID